MGPKGGTKAVQQKFPTRWLTYNQRIKADLDQTFAEESGREFFDDDYMATLIAPIKQQEDWILKLIALQFTIILFLVVGFASKDVTLNVFGVALGNIPGIKEALLAFSTTITLFVVIVTSSRDTTLFLAQEISKRVSDPKYLAYSNFALPSHFNFRMYLPREYDRWLFANWFTKSVARFILFLAVLIFLAILATSVLIHVVIMREIWRNPTVGAWSYGSLTYVAAAYILNMLIILRRSVPFPYIDKGPVIH